MKLLTKIQAAAWLCLASCPAFAADMDYQTISDAAQRSTDLSRQALVMIFGNVVISPFQPGQPTLIGSLFALLNGVLCAVAFVYFAVVTLKSLYRSGQEGKVFSAGRTALYPIMSFAGFIMLVPTGSGWALSQLIMLWSASTMGIGSANVMVDKAAELIDSGMSLVVQPTAPSTRSAARAIFEMNLCKYATNSELATLSQFGQNRTAPMTLSGSDGDYTIGNGSAICGTARIPDAPKPMYYGEYPLPVNIDGVITAQRQALKTMMSTLDVAADDWVNGYLSRRDKDTGAIPDAETVIQNAAAAYETTVNQALNQLNYKDSLQSQLVSQLKSYGWISLGAWYHTFAVANSKTNAVANAIPVTSGSSLQGETGTGDLYRQILSAYRSQKQNSGYTAPLGTQVAKDDAVAVSTTDPDAVFVGIFRSPMQRVTTYFASRKFGTDAGFSDQINPLIKMQDIGDATLWVTEAGMAAYTVALTASSSADHSLLGTVGNLVVWNPGAVAKDVILGLSPPFWFIILLLFSIGFSLAVFLPAIPFLYWMVGVFNWFVSVLVGCAAGPMWSATHLGAEEDRGSRSAYGYIFLIDMMLRPSIMVLGFFFAAAAAVAGGTLLNLLFGPAIANANADSTTGLVLMWGWLLVYARSATFGVSRLFGLQATLADYVISFLGGSGVAGIMGGMVDDVKGLFASAGGGARKVPGVRDKTNTGGDGKDGIKG